jgi:outer membrane lipoprotein carrier protein
MNKKSYRSLLLILVFCSFSFIVFPAATGSGEETQSRTAMSRGESSMSLDEIIDSVEKRYAVPGFSVQFFQETILKALDIIDTARGRILIKRPGMMRWEYDTPERQTIITDSHALWIYRHEDNQVMTGKAPSFFGDGKGAGFLSDMTLIRKQFFILPGENIRKDYYHVRLLPKEKTLDISSVNLLISKKTFEVNQVVTHNAYGDETRITMNDFQVQPDLDPALFRFTIPDGADVVQLDE